MANQLTATLTLSYGDASVQGAVLARRPLTFALAYAEESTKIVHVPANTTDFQVDLDTINAPKFLFARTMDVDVTIKLSDAGANEVPSALSADSGWVMICNPAGQAVKRLLITTPATPAGGAHVEILAFE